MRTIISMILIGTIINTLAIVAVAAHLPGVDGTCVSKWEKTQDRLLILPGIGPTTVQQPLDPIQE